MLSKVKYHVFIRFSLRSSVT